MSVPSSGSSAPLPEFGFAVLASSPEVSIRGVNGIGSSFSAPCGKHESWFVAVLQRELVDGDRPSEISSHVAAEEFDDLGRELRVREPRSQHVDQQHVLLLELLRARSLGDGWTVVGGDEWNRDGRGAGGSEGEIAPGKRVGVFGHGGCSGRGRFNRATTGLLAP